MGALEQGADATHNRWLTIPRTLSFVFNGDDVLLIKRASSRRVFPNRFNGVGGHIERDEDPYMGALREIREETGLAVHDLQLRAIHHIDAGGTTGIMLFVFTAISEHRNFSQHHEEGTLHWVAQDAVMTLDLVEDLPHVLPRILKMGKLDAPYFAHVSYDTEDMIQLRIADEV